MIVSADFEKIADFAKAIGIPVGQLPNDAGFQEFLPGIAVWRGTVFVSRERCLGYDDALHEIGHVAILPSRFRPFATGDVEQSTSKHIQHWCDRSEFMKGTEGNPIYRAILQCGDQEAMAWGYAAQVHLGFRPRTSFVVMEEMEWRKANEQEKEADLAALAVGAHMGVHGLQAAGMTRKAIWPKMIRWAQA